MTLPGKTLAEYIDVRGRYRCSIHLEKDFSSGSQNGEYMVTPTAREALRRMAEGMSDVSPGQSPLDVPFSGSSRSSGCKLLSKAWRKRAKRRGGLPQELSRIWGLIVRALERTGALWPEIGSAYGQVWALVRILTNEAGLSGAGLRQVLKATLTRMEAQEGLGKIRSRIWMI